MQPEEVKELIKSNTPDSTVEVTGDGRHFEAIVISKIFAGMSAVERQRFVYKAIGEPIKTGEIHALSIKAKTPEEWDQSK